MPALRELQTDFLDALLGRSRRAAAHIATSGLAPERRLDIYRNNHFESLTEALAAVYPTIDKLVGRGFFRYLAHDYIVAHPSRSGNLHDFGSELPRFLTEFEAARTLPYLGDCARLDWAWHAVFHTEAAPALDAATTLAAIAALPEAERPGVCFRLQPACRLVASPYPVFAIWQANQGNEEPPAIDLDAGAEQVLLAQRAGEVSIERIAAAEHALLQALAEGATLGTAIGRALALDTAFDAAQSIAHHLAAGTLAGMTPARSSDAASAAGSQNAGSTAQEHAMPVKPIPEGYHSATPYLMMKNGAKAIEFYRQAFGATELLRLVAPGGAIAHAEVKIGDSPIMLADETEEMKDGAQRSPQSLGGCSTSVMLYVENVDARFEQALAAGARELRPLADQFYGDRSGTLVDPFGHVWTLATHIEDVSPEEIDRRARKLFGG